MVDGPEPPQLGADPIVGARRDTKLSCDGAQVRHQAAGRSFVRKLNCHEAMPPIAVAGNVHFGQVVNVADRCAGRECGAD